MTGTMVPPEPAAKSPAGSWDNPYPHFGIKYDARADLVPRPMSIAWVDDRLHRAEAKANFRCRERLVRVVLDEEGRRRMRDEPSGLWEAWGGGVPWRHGTPWRHGGEARTSVVSLAWCTAPDRRRHFRVVGARLRCFGPEEVSPMPFYADWMREKAVETGFAGLLVYPRLLDLVFVGSYPVGGFGAMNGFQVALRKDPFDRTTWLVYADFLEDDGDAETAGVIRTVADPMNAFTP